MRKNISLGLLVLVVLVVVYLLILEKKDVQRADLNSEVSFAKDRLHDYLSSIFYNNQIQIDSVECNETECAKGIEPVPGSVTWPLLSLSIDYIKAPTEKSLSVMKNMLGKFDELRIKQNRDSQSNLYHFFIAFKATSDTDFLKYFAEGMSSEFINLVVSGDTKRKGRIPMIKAERLRNIFYLFELLDSDDYFQKATDVSVGIRQAYTNEKEYRSGFNDAAKDIYDVLRKEVDTSPESLKDLAQGDEQCWSLYGQYFYYKTTKNSQGITAVLWNIKDLFQESSPQMERFTSTHSILPCIEILTQADFYGESNQDLKLLHQGLIRDLLNQSFDNPKSPLCTGDGGFLGRLKESEIGRCDKNYKGIHDQAWIFRLLSLYESKEGFN